MTSDGDHSLVCEPRASVRPMLIAMCRSLLVLLLVAESDGAAVASLMVTYEWSDWRAGWFWWIQSLYVEHDNTAAQAVYERLGMHRTHYHLYEVDFVLGQASPSS